jgi:glycosyltransferase involved in cell wall biosynthesis
VKVLLCVASARVAYGGPALSVSALARNLALSGAETAIWCPDGSAPEIELDGSSSSLQRLMGSFPQAMKHFGRPDVIHDNGIWWSHNRVIARYARRHCIPRLVSPRGMLEPWARQHKQLRKALAWRLYQRRDLLTASALHATSPQELDNLSVLFPYHPARMIGNGLDMPPLAKCAFDRGVRAGGLRQALFLGRLHPVKGLPMLVAAWKQACPGWKLVLAGPDEGGHRQELEQLIAAAGLADAIEFAGPVRGDEKDRLFAKSQLFILPSHSESFGMSIGEAFAHALPVITTQNVPWPQISEANCGWRVPATPEGLASAVREATTCEFDELAVMGRRGRALVAREFGWERITDQFIAFYEALISQGPRPDIT